MDASIAEERARRTAQWEEKHGKKLRELTRAEWIEAMMEIGTMTRQEAEDYLNYLIMNR